MAQLDYRMTPNAGQVSDAEGCEGYDTPTPAPGEDTMPQINWQDKEDPILYTPVVQGFSPDHDTALTFERAQSGAPKPYAEEPGYLQISDPRSMS